MERLIEERSNQNQAGINTAGEFSMGKYSEDYQPHYTDAGNLRYAQSELSMIEGVTTPENIERVRHTYGEIAKGSDERMIIIAGPCSEPISESQNPEEIADRYDEIIRVCSEFTTHFALRACGQGAKPRSNEFEKLSDGTVVPSYYGDMINDLDPRDRKPDPNRLIVAAKQSLTIQEILTDRHGQHIDVSHEALVKIYEDQFIEIVDGKKILTSCDIPWIGKRTNEPNGIHVDMLKDVVNSVGIKVGSDDSPDKIAQLATMLNPKKEPGKLIFVMRVGEKNPQEAYGILQAIKKYAPESIILCDPMHGNTVSLKNGMKTREIPSITSEIRTLAESARNMGLRLHGLHLEASGRNDREECVYERGATPSDKSIVDPELNNDQLAFVLEQTKESFLPNSVIRAIRTKKGKVHIPSPLV